MRADEIRRRLVDFARKWSLYRGSERAEAQTFLNELFACYGTDRGDAGARFEEPSQHELGRNPRWWQFLWPRPEFRARLPGVGRFIAGTATGKRVLFVWCEVDWRPSNSTNLFALDTDYAIGVLTSRIHTEWAAKKSSTLEDRIRYTPSSAFDTFPWPRGDPAQRERIGGLAADLLSLRSTLCHEHGLGLTALYNALDDGGFRALRDAHEALDLAVVAAYGWSSVLLDDVRERNRALYDLNAAIRAGQVGYAPF